MKPFELDKFLLYVFSPLLLGTIVGFLFKDYFSVLEQFNRNIIIPPIAFIIVWSVLYLLMGIWYYIYDRDDGEERIKKIYWILLIVNLLFTPILFYFKNIFLAMVDVIVLLAGIGIIFVMGIKQKRKYTYLLLPYILWLLTALTLTIDLLANN